MVNPEFSDKVAERKVKPGGASGCTSSLTPRRLVWVHVTAVTFLTVCMFHAGGDLHAVYPAILYLLLIPACYSVLLFPLLAMFILVRERETSIPGIFAEGLLEFMHCLVMAAGFSSY